jgi:hypothetical protein
MLAQKQVIAQFFKLRLYEKSNEPWLSFHPNGQISF